MTASGNYGVLRSDHGHYHREGKLEQRCPLLEPDVVRTMMMPLSHKLRLVRCAMIGLSLALSHSAFATCTIFQDRGFGGSHWTLRNGDDMKMVSQPSLGVSDGIHRFLYDPTWNDQVSSFRVDSGCTLTLWEDVDQGGHHFRSNRSYSYVGDRWNDKASEAVCECPGLPNF